MKLRWSRFVAAILCAPLLCLPCARSFAENQNEEIQWFVNLAKANNGKAFCAPPTTTVHELLDAFATFSKAHPDGSARRPRRDNYAIAYAQAGNTALAQRWLAMEEDVTIGRLY
jgi:hypothetical protein